MDNTSAAEVSAERIVRADRQVLCDHAGKLLRASGTLSTRRQETDYKFEPKADTLWRIV
jgi:hypothetical protein